MIGLGWFGEIHCETIVGVPISNSRRCARARPDRLKQHGGEVRRAGRPIADYRDMLADPDIDAVSIVTMWDQHTDAGDRGARGRQARVPRKADRLTVADAQKIIAAAPRRKGILFIGHICRFNPRYRMAKQADRRRQHRQDRVAVSSRRNIPAAWTPTILNKIGPIVGDAIHDTDLMLWFTGDRVVSAYAQTVDVRGLKHPDIGQTMYRFAGGATATLETVWCMPEKTPFDIDERMSIIGTEGFIHIQDTFPNLGIAASDKFHSPDTTYWPEFDGARGGALKAEFELFRRLHSASAKGRRSARRKTPPQRSRPPSPPRESARTGQVVKIG